MYFVSAIFVLILQSGADKEVIIPDSNCDEIKCSHVYDPICGVVKHQDGSRIVRVYQNVCHFNKIRCQSKEDMQQVPDEICRLNREILTLKTRRLQDSSIVGAHQACNHTCPTFCVDTYEPVCAQIWQDPDLTKSTFRPMVNHCHVDLLSCSLALNVTILPLGKCYKNVRNFEFMQQMAALKSLQLLD